MNSRLKRLSVRNSFHIERTSGKGTAADGAPAAGDRIRGGQSSPIAIRRLRGRMSVHTRPMWSRHS